MSQRPARRRLGATAATAMITALLAGAGTSGAVTYSGTYAIRNARVIDGTGAPAAEHVTILVDGDRITRVGHDLDVGERQVLDATGLTLLPGLIDSHVHLNSVPGAMIRKDPRDVYERLRRTELPAYVAAGVTTVLDAAAPKDFLAWAREQVAATGAGPDILMLAPFLTPAGGYFGDASMRGEAFDELWEPIDSPERLVAELDAARGVPGVVGTKVTMEKGFGPFDVWPVFDATMRARIREEAAARGLAVFVHSMSDPEHQLALDLAPKVMVHAGYQDDAPSAETLARMRDERVAVVSTLSVTDQFLIKADPSRLDDPILRLITPPVEIASARDAGAWDAIGLATARLSVPSWVPDFVPRLSTRLYLSDWMLRRRVALAKQGVRALRDAGIPILMGTDSGCWPVFTALFHGFTSLREVELLGEAGLTPMEALLASTSVPARVLGIDADVGTVTVGKRANLMLVKGNPLADLATIRNVVWTVKAGVARTPQDWMASAGALP